MDSFPASDPPGYRSMSVGGPAAEPLPKPATKQGGAEWSRLVAAVSIAFVAGGLAVAAVRAISRTRSRRSAWLRPAA
jgi:hypothetical protein